MNILIEQDKIDQYPEGVAVILNILGHPEALVTDYSQIGDFDPDESALSLLDAKPGDFLWELAERIEKENEDEV